MKREIRRVLTITAFAVSALILIVIVNQLIQFANFLGGIHPVFGQVSLILFLIVAAVAVLAPVWLYFKLPGRLIPPETDEGAEFDRYIENLSKRLGGNPIVKMDQVSGVDDVREAIHVLDKESDKSIKRTANRAFITTAISQNGALDALFILGLQFRLIWEIAHIYAQRPTIKDLSYLYTNVMVTAFIASSIDEAEYYEIVESSMSQGIGSVLSFVPGTTMVINSVITGSSNAFLTLRVGKVAQQYCGTLVKRRRQSIRNSATAEAAKMLAGIVYDGTKIVVKHIGKAPLRLASKPFRRGKKEE
ncbi:DUF697 domain-containing protein [Rhodohalobacter barkolensis]|uniref:DUF697 domain-containing protein n=1 Tax=Rhodohalobacter barkolensis TaxID=2053187 RepID=A0A2N0VDZ4_9BACT|nr:DUF697 domain-containing protein [Rhodohalobacter barkolensis]PKD42414.1 hypothetical protein CWD77_15355 [Rhodohalobacter barkolensis]